jgi:hypothetical protein
LPPDPRNEEAMTPYVEIEVCRAHPRSLLGVWCGSAYRICGRNDTSFARDSPGKAAAIGKV